MGIFYNPPPPPTANNAGTPPEPHVPIGTQGNQPPRYTTALMLVAVLAGWPADLEPRLARPNDQQKTKIAPLTLTYGQQPQPQGPLTNAEYTQLVTSWPPDLEPRLARPNEQQQKIAALTLTYGQQPPRFSVVSRMVAAVGAWPVDLEPRLGRPNDQQQKIAPLTLTYGRQPTPTSFITPPELAALVQAWPSTDVGPAVPWPNWVRRTSTPLLAQPRVDQPTPLAPLGPSALAGVVGAWAQDWGTQTAPKTAATLLQASAPPYRSLPRSLWSAWDPAWLAPPAPVTIAPLTLAYGSAPIPSALLSPTELGQLLASWVQTWDAQTAPKNAGWNVPPVLSAVAFAPFQRQILTAWESPWIAPPPLVKIAPLTLVYGQAPPPQSAPNRQLGAVTAWTPDPVQQPAARALPPPTVITRVTYAPLPSLIWSAWEPVWVQPPAPVRIVTLTLPTGATPPVRSGNDRQLVARAAWDETSRLPPQTARLAPFTQAVIVPWIPQPISILSAWQIDVFTMRRLAGFAPLMVRSGDAPSPRAALSPVQMALISGAWQLPFVAPPPLVCFQLSAASTVIAATPDVIVLIPADDLIVLIPPDELDVDL